MNAVSQNLLLEQLELPWLDAISEQLRKCKAHLGVTLGEARSHRFQQQNEIARISRK